MDRLRGEGINLSDSVPPGKPGKGFVWGRFGGHRGGRNYLVSIRKFEFPDGNTSISGGSSGQKPYFKGFLAWRIAGSCMFSSGKVISG